MSHAPARHRFATRRRCRSSLRDPERKLTTASAKSSLVATAAASATAGSTTRLEVRSEHASQAHDPFASAAPFGDADVEPELRSALRDRRIGRDHHNPIQVPHHDRDGRTTLRGHPLRVGRRGVDDTQRPVDHVGRGTRGLSRRRSRRTRVALARIGFLGVADVPLSHSFGSGFPRGRTRSDHTRAGHGPLPHSFNNRSHTRARPHALCHGGNDIVFVIAGRAGRHDRDHHRDPHATRSAPFADQDVVAPGQVLTSVVKHVGMRRLGLPRNHRRKARSGHRVLGLADDGVGLTDRVHSARATIGTRPTGLDCRRCAGRSHRPIPRPPFARRHAQEVRQDHVHFVRPVELQIVSAGNDTPCPKFGPNRSSAWRRAPESMRPAAGAPSTSAVGATIAREVVNSKPSGRPNDSFSMRGYSNGT